MPGLASFMTFKDAPTLRRAIQRLPATDLRVQKVMFINAVKIQNLAKMRSPVKSSRMKTNIEAKRVTPYEYIIGTNVRSKGGFLYPLRQEFDTTLRHPKGGQAAFLRQSLRDRAESIKVSLRNAIRAAFGGRPASGGEAA